MFTLFPWSLKRHKHTTIIRNFKFQIQNFFGKESTPKMKCRISNFIKYKIGRALINANFVFSRILNFITMKQRVLTFTKRFNTIDSYSINLDEVTQRLNESGWTIKQIVSTSFQHQISKEFNSYPVMAITLLVEKD